MAWGFQIASRAIEVGHGATVSWGTAAVGRLRGLRLLERSTGMRRSFLLAAAFVSVLVVAGALRAREIHVSRRGAMRPPAAPTTPYLTINKAAAVAQPGDTVIVHAGTYREWVKPARGGTRRRRAASSTGPRRAKKCFIKGSERDHVLESKRPAASGGSNCRIVLRRLQPLCPATSPEAG